VTAYDPENAEIQPWPPGEERSELVQRLRMLSWPEVSPDVRQRCWEQLARQVAELGDEPPSTVPEPSEPGHGRSRPRVQSCWDEGDGLHERRFGRHEFASRLAQGGYKGALGERVASARRAVLSQSR
jgi:hypothetical protein